MIGVLLAIGLAATAVVGTAAAQVLPAGPTFPMIEAVEFDPIASGTGCLQYNVTAPVLGQDLRLGLLDAAGGVHVLDQDQTWATIGPDLNIVQIVLISGTPSVGYYVTGQLPGPILDRALIPPGTTRGCDTTNPDIPNLADPDPSFEDGDFVASTDEGYGICNAAGPEPATIPDRGAVQIRSYPDDSWDATSTDELVLFTRHAAPIQVQINAHQKDHGTPLWAGEKVFQVRSMGGRTATLQAAEGQLAWNQKLADGSVESHRYAARIWRINNPNPLESGTIGQVDIFVAGPNGAEWITLTTIPNLPADFDELPVTLRVAVDLDSKQYQKVTVLIGGTVHGPFHSNAGVGVVTVPAADNWAESMTFSIEASTLPNCIPRTEQANLAYDLSRSGIEGDCPTQVLLCLVPDSELAPRCGNSYVSRHLVRGDKPTEYADVIIGTTAADFMYGLGGHDIICSGPGNDTVYGGDGNDTIIGRDGDDTIYGGLGVDRIWGGDGNDAIAGGGGSDRIYGGFGSDAISGAGGADRIYGGGGTDVIFGGGGADILRGGPGNDTIQGNYDADMIYGDAGDDTLRGAGGEDRIWGAAGADDLYGGNGDDEMYGGAGDDTMNGQAGVDRCRDFVGVNVFINC